MMTNLRSCMTGVAAGAALLLSASAVQAQHSYTDGLVAVVNSEVITVYDVGVFAITGEQAIRSRYTAEDLKNPTVLKEMHAEIEALRKDAAHQLINQQLIVAEFNGRNYTVPSELLEKRLDSIVAGSAYGGDWGKFEDSLEARDSSLEEFREMFEKRLAVQMITGQEVDRKASVTPQQVQQYWLENKESLSKPSRVRLAMIEVRHARHADAKERVAAIEKAFAAGKSFEDLAKEVSDGPNRSGGGEIGWQKLKDLRPEFSRSLGNFDDGTVSPAISLSGSTYFLKALEAERVAAPTYESARPRLEAALYRQERAKRYKQWTESLRQKAYVRIFFKD